MIKIFLSFLIMFGLKNNVVVSNTSGVLLFQREKKYSSFRYIDSIFVMIGVIVVSIIAFLLRYYVFDKFDFLFAEPTIVMLVICLYFLLISKYWAKSSFFSKYLYENSFTFAYDIVYTFSVYLILDFSLPIVDFAMMVLAVIVVIFAITVIMGLFIKLLNRGYLNRHFRDISIRLYMFAILSILLYYASILV